VPFEEVAITSGFHVLTGILPEGAFQLPDVKDVVAVAAKAKGHKCARCWRVLPEVGSHKDHPDLCNRCDAAVTKAPA
jgi:isoleucyl-tRNA synthetase